jgi:hypothetical protein
MKRLFPRALLEATGLLGLALLLNGGCSEDHGVKPGAPVLTQLTIVEQGSTPTNITADTPMCGTATSTGADAGGADASADAGGADASADAGTGAAIVTDGGTDTSADAGSDAGTDAAAEAAAPMSVPDEPAATGAACDPAMHGVCKKGDADWCRCLANSDDMTMGTWNCEAFAPLSVVVATFDRLLDTDPLDPGDGGNTSRDDIAMLTAVPPPPTAVGTATDYSSTGSPTGAVFNVYGPMFFNNFRSGGPSLQVGASPAMPADATVTITLDPTKVRAKDGKTAFTAMGMLASGSLTFKTGPFNLLSIDVPTAPPPPPADGGVDAEADGAAAGSSDGGDAASDAGDAGLTDASLPDASLVDAIVAEAGVDGGADAKADAADGATADAIASEVGDASATTPPPEPGAPVPADMNAGAVTLTFNNLVGMDIVSHIKMTEDGKPFTGFLTPDKFPAPDTQSFPMTTVAIRPTDAWAAGKTYVIFVDANAADVVGDKLGTPAAAAFMLAN